MEEISHVAKAHYQASTEYLQSLARDFFNAMDKDDDGKIDLHEFMEFMKEEGRVEMAKCDIFNQLDGDQDGFLDFFEVLTLYYIIKSGRPFCRQCTRFIASTYLTCVGCLHDPNSRSFYLCLDCYGNQTCDHIHNDMSYFLDNYSLLEAMTKLRFGDEPRSRLMGNNSVAVQGRPHLVVNHTQNSSIAMVQVPQQWHPVHNYHAHTSVVHNHTWIQNNYQQPQDAQQPQPQRWQTALGALNGAINLAAAVGSLSFCSIL